MEQVLHAAARRDVLEQHRHLPPRRRLDAEGGKFEVAPGGDQLALEADRPSGAQDVAVEREPALGLRADDLAQAFPRHLLDAGMLRVGAVGGDVDVVAQGPVRAVDELDDAVALVHLLEQRAVMLLALGQGRALGPLLGHVPHHAREPHGAAIRVALDLEGAGDPAGQAGQRVADAVHGLFDHLSAHLSGRPFARGDRRRVLRREPLGEGGEGILLLHRQAVQAAEGGARMQNARAQVEGEDADPGGVLRPGEGALRRPQRLRDPKARRFDARFRDGRKRLGHAHACTCSTPPGGTSATVRPENRLRDGVSRDRVRGNAGRSPPR
ncbi:hypothetical protein CHKEEEPN_3211 [Methylorubrum podarium]|nr:hypothetical protein CHKEEEPN_3211 [Methylorubrum podarium]